MFHLVKKEPQIPSESKFYSATRTAQNDSASQELHIHVSHRRDPNLVQKVQLVEDLPLEVLGEGGEGRRTDQITGWDTGDGGGPGGRRFKFGGLQGMY